jgi:hypothetical protein
VLGLIFLRYADHKFSAAVQAMPEPPGGRRKVGKLDYQAARVLYLPGGEDIGQAINEAINEWEANKQMGAAFVVSLANSLMAWARNLLINSPTSSATCPCRGW